MQKRLLEEQIRLLQHALKEIRSGKHRYICTSIRYAAGFSIQARETICAKIMDAIYPDYTIEDWKSSKLNRQGSPRDIRIHWLKTSIKRGKARLAKL